MRRMSDILVNEINELGLMDCVRLANNFSLDSSTYTLLHERAKMLYQEILTSNKQIVESGLIESTIDLVQILMLFKKEENIQKL